MKIQSTMTERDKKILFFLGVFVIVVCFGYWGILPQITAIKQIKQDTEVATETQYVNEMKLLQLPVMMIDYDNLVAEAAEAREGYYEWMTNDEIDKMITGMALDYQLNAYDLYITNGESMAVLEPYQYATVAETDYDYSGEEGMDLAADDSVETGIREVAISMRLGGDREQIQKLIDDLSDSDQALWVTSYSWTISAEPVLLDDGTYEYKEFHILNLSLKLYMCIPEETK